MSKSPRERGQPCPRVPEFARTWLSALLISLVVVANCVGAADLGNIFRNPPASAQPWVYWYWYHGAVSRAGITADLEAMKHAGIGGAYLMPIQDVDAPPLFDPPARQLSSNWWDLVRFSFREADRLGLKIAMHDCDGFATAGGPWITPELAMQRVVWSETSLAGGNRIDLALEQPPTKEQFYRDIAVLAFPTPPGEGVTSRSIIPRVTTSVAGVDAQGFAGTGFRFRSEEPCWIQYEFEKPFTCRSIVIHPGGGNYQGNRLIVEVSDDGNTFRTLGRLEAPRHGWQDTDADATHSIVPTTARFFRFVYDKEGTEPGSEDLDSAKWKNRLLVEQIELSSAPRIPEFEGKSGAVWRRSSRATTRELPDELCVPLKGIVNLTRNFGRNGRLVWDAPPGRWTILRVGYTPTGHQNETGGGGKGLECDKFNPQAARMQFDGWFGETVRQIGPELANRALKIFHIDSWEAGSQNWSPVFLDEFKHRRSYDPTPYLPAFAGIPVGSADISERFLFDVRQTITDLTSDNFFKPMAELAHRHGCAFSAESVAPTMMGDGMRHFGAVNIPMGEFWLRSPTHDKPNDIADAVSAARVYGRPIVQAEAFTELRLQWDEHPGMLKALGDHNFCLGINRFVFHVFMENPWLDRRPGITLNGVGAFLQRDQTWWSFARPWIDYTRRCQALLQQGTPVADVLYFTGEELPSRAVIPERRIPALPPGYAADSINRDALLHLASVRDGRITLPGGSRYRILLLPNSSSMTPELAARLRDLVGAGAIVFGRAPERSLSLEGYPGCDDKVRGIAEQVWGISSGTVHQYGRGSVLSGGSIESVMRLANIEPDFLASATNGSPAEEIEWTHRSIGADGQLYFVSNQRAEARTIRVSLRTEGASVCCLDPVSGRLRAIPEADRSNGRTAVSLDLAPHGSLFVAIGGVLNSGMAVDAPPGTNTLVSRIAGPWQVAFDPEVGGPERPVSFPELVSWTTRSEPGIKFYSGRAVYANAFNWPGKAVKGRVWLDLGAVANLSRVIVNGHDCGTLWTEPYRVEITDAVRPGSNALEIQVINTWANRLIGDRVLAAAERKTWTNAADRFQGDALLPSGLLGPVSLEIK